MTPPEKDGTGTDPHKGITNDAELHTLEQGTENLPMTMTQDQIADCAQQTLRRGNLD